MKVVRLAVAIAVFAGIIQISPAFGGSTFKLQKIGECKRATSQNYWYTNSWTLGDVLIESQITNDYSDSRIYATDIKTCKRLWERELECADTTGVAREGDRLYLINTQFTRERAFITSESDNSWGGSPSIQCFDINTGKRIWINSFERGTTRISNPVIIGDLVYAGFETVFYALRKSDGKEFWRYSSNDHLMTTHLGLINTETEIFALGGKSEAYWGNDYFSLHCLDAKTGKLKWKYDRVGKLKHYRTAEGVGLDVERIVDYAFDQSTVCLRLIKETKGNDIGVTYSILALDRSTGKIIWEIEDFDKEFKSDFRNTIFTNNNHLFVKHTITNEKRIFDLKTGNLKRKITTSSLLMASKLKQVYIINNKGIEAVAFPEGKRIWYRPMQFCSTPDEVHSFDFLANTIEQDSKIFALTVNGLICLNQQTGKILDSWNYRIKPLRVSQSGKNTVVCEIKNSEVGNNTILLFQY